MDLSFEPSSFSGWAPLFPLPGVVLLPGALLPLHIFEPRYRLMLKDALEGEKLIAMALLKGGPDDEIEDWVGLGRIVAHEPLPDGRSNLLLAGLRRARVLEEDRSRPYRKGRLEVAEDADEGDVGRVAELVDRVPRDLVRDPVRLGVARKIQVPPGAFLDLVADALQLAVEEKQRLLASPSVSVRASLLAGMLEARLGRPTWPPRFSRN